MKKDLLESQRNVCLKCEYRNKELTDVIFCLFPHKCPKVRIVDTKEKAPKD